MPTRAFITLIYYQRISPTPSLWSETKIVFPQVSNFFDTIILKKAKREFITHTGSYKGKRISVLSTGIGTDNIDIVLNELDALANIDFDTRTIKKKTHQITDCSHWYFRGHTT